MISFMEFRDVLQRPSTNDPKVRVEPFSVSILEWIHETYVGFRDKHASKERKKNKMYQHLVPTNPKPEKSPDEV